MEKKKPQAYNPELVVVIKKSSYRPYNAKEIETKFVLEDYNGLPSSYTLEKVAEHYKQDKHTYLDYKVFKNVVLHGSKFEFVSETRGRSSIKLVYLIDDLLQVEFFISTFADMIRTMPTINNFSGYFVFEKKGSNYGIKVLTQEQVNDLKPEMLKVSRFLDSLNFKDTTKLGE